MLRTNKERSAKSIYLIITPVSTTSHHQVQNLELIHLSPIFIFLFQVLMKEH